MPGTEWTICATWCSSPRRCRPLWKPGLRGAGAPPAAHACGGAEPPAVWTCRWPLWPVCAVNKRCLTGCVALWRICTVRAPRWTSASVPWAVDAPLPTWTPRGLWSAAVVRNPQHMVVGAVSGASAVGRACALAGGTGAPRLAGRGRHGRQPWLGDHRIRNVAVLPGAACEMALAAARAVLGEASEVRDICFEQALLLDEADHGRHLGGVVIAGRARFHRGDRCRQRASAARWRSSTCRRGGAACCAACSTLLAAHPCREDGAEVRKRLDRRGVQYGPAFSGLAAVHTGEGATGTVLVEVALPGQSARDKAHTPALLDACFQSVAVPSRRPGPGREVLGLPLGSAPTARPAAPTTVHTGDESRYFRVEADLDVLDEHGLLAVRRAAIGRRPRMAERLHHLEAASKELPEVDETPEPGC